MHMIAYLLTTAITIYIYIIILQVALGWLIAFDVVNSSNAKARNLMRLLHRATDPLYKPIGKFIPPIAGLDLTPLIVIIGLQVLQGFIYSTF